jgi:RNA polymerase sigma-70 factor (ECF subfamily)
MLDPSVREPLVAAIPKLRAFAISLSRDRERAEDLVQGALVRACDNIGSFDRSSKMDAWLCTILHNHFYSEWKRDRRASRAINIGIQRALCGTGEAFHALTHNREAGSASCELALAFTQTLAAQVTENFGNHITETARPCGVAGRTTCSRLPFVTALRATRGLSEDDRSAD